MEKMLKQELGERRLDFEKLGREPIASASIGQVHGAFLNGEKVAIKIQYPRIADSIDSDLSVLKKLAVSLSLVTGRSIDWSEVFKELSETLKNEANYQREGEFLDEYGRRIAGDRELSQRVFLPRWIQSHSSARVLTMSFAEGIPLRDWVESSPSSEALHKMASLVLNLFIKEFYEWGIVQTDPNFANFLVHGDQLGLLDFGSTKVFTDEFKKDYIAFLKVLDKGTRDQVVQAAHEFRLLDERESAESKTLFFEFMQQSVLPFMFRDGLFDFASQAYSNQTNEMGKNFVFSLKYTPPPSKLLFLHRRLGGTFALLKKMKVRLDVRPYWENIIGGEYDPGSHLK
jgi:aarF domain-containing kinase